MNPASKKVALVTGSARGIGRAIALQLARDGYAVIINGVHSSGEDVKHEIEQAGGVAATCRGDVSIAADREALVAFALNTFGRIDLLVNNAGVAPEVRADLLEAGEESFDRLININLKGPYFLTQLVAKEMIRLQSEKKIERGRIAFITSVSAYATSTNRGDYCISKAGLSMAAALWAHRLAEHQIPVLEFRPGVIATDMTASVQEKYDNLFAAGLLPQNRWGNVEDVARAPSPHSAAAISITRPGSRSTSAAASIFAGSNRRSSCIA